MKILSYQLYIWMLFGLICRYKMIFPVKSKKTKSINSDNLNNLEDQNFLKFIKIEENISNGFFKNNNNSTIYNNNTLKLEIINNSKPKNYKYQNTNKENLKTINQKNLDRHKNESLIKNINKNSSYQFNKNDSHFKDKNTYKLKNYNNSSTRKNHQSVSQIEAKADNFSPDLYENNIDESNLSRFNNFIFESKCNSNRCAFPKGVCLNGSEFEEKICQCLTGYLNFKFFDNEISVCEYKQKSQFIAFLLEIFFFFAGNIYLGFYFYACLKGSVYLIIILIATFKLPCKLCGFENMIKSKFNCCPWFEYTTFIIIIFGIFCWQTVDLLKIMTNNNKDGFDMPILDYF